MTINNKIMHSHEIANTLHTNRPLFEIPTVMYRVKFNGKFVFIKEKGEWSKISSAKRAFKAYLQRTRFVIEQSINYAHYNTVNELYRCEKDDIELIYNSFVADGLIEFVEIKVEN